MAFGNGPRIVTDGLVLSLDAGDRNSYISGSTTWRDLSGNNYSGSLFNEPIFTTGSGGTIVFDGVNDFVQLSNISLGSQFTLDIISRVKPFDSVSDIQPLFGVGNPFNDLGNGLIITQDYLAGEDGITISLRNSLNQAITYAYDIGWINNSFNFLTLAFSQTKVVVYLNSVKKNEGDITIDLSLINTNNIFIGKYGGAAIYLNGSIASAKIYNRALSDQEVLQNYNAQKSRFGL